MPVKKVFVDENENELECFVNDKNALFIGVGPRGEDSGYYSGYITLNKSDVKELIAMLQELEPAVAHEPE